MDGRSHKRRRTVPASSEVDPPRSGARALSHVPIMRLEPAGSTQPMMLARIGMPRHGPARELCEASAVKRGAISLLAFNEPTLDHMLNGEKHGLESRRR